MDLETESFPVIPLACMACGMGLPPDAAFCSSCGRPIKPLVASPSTRVAPRTGASKPLDAEAEKLPSLQRIQDELPARYRVIQLRGRGGMGMVFKCQDTSLDRLVAIKLLADRHGSDPAAQRRFLREARAQAIINHNNVAKILNVGVSTKGQLFLVMEYVDGRDLRQAIQDEPGGFEPQRACQLIEQACAGMAEAHSAGVVHRDLKPSNLMLQQDHRGVETLKVLDLGLAKIVCGSTDLRTITVDTVGMLVGTPAYMSPEQVNGSSVDARSDIYALGVVLFELLTGRRPFESETLEGWLYQHLNVHPPIPSSLRPELARYPELNSIVMWTLTKAPQERPARVEDLALALQQVRARAVAGAGAAPSAHPPVHADSGQHQVGLAFVDGMPFLPSSSRLNPTSVLRNRDSSEYLEAGQGHRSPDPALLQRAKYEEEAIAAEKAEAAHRWSAALEHWQQALKYADDETSVASRIEALRREMAFDQVLATAGTHAAAGEWARAEESLASAATLRPAHPAVEQARARLPRRLIEAWLEGTRARLAALPETQTRQGMLRRLAVAHARAGDMDGAIRILQEESREAEVRIRGLAVAAHAAIQAGLREGLRPYLDRALSAAGTQPDPGARGRTCLELGRSFSAYGDAEAAATAFQNALAGFVAAAGTARAAALGAVEADPPWAKAKVTTTHRKLPSLASPDKGNSFEDALAAVAQAQAEAGLAEDGLSTAAMIEDPWNRAQALAQVAQALAKGGRSVEAERIAEQITFRLPKAKALGAVALSRIYRGDMETAEEMIRDIASPEEKASIQGFLSAAWSRRGEQARAARLAQEAEGTAREVPSPSTRFDTLLNSAEPLAQIRQLDLAAPLLMSARLLIDRAADPVERLHGLLRLARLRELSRAGAAPGASSASLSATSELLETLRRALGTLSRIATRSDRDECLEALAKAFGAAGASALADELLLQCRDESERAMVFLGLAAGLI